MSDLSSLWKVHIFLVLAVYQAAVFLLMDSEMEFIICEQMFWRQPNWSQGWTEQQYQCWRTAFTNHISLVLAPPSSSYFQSLTVLQKVTGRKKNLIHVCMCVQVCFSLERHSPVQNKKNAKTEPVLECLYCKPISNSIKEGNIYYCWSFFFLRK